MGRVEGDYRYRFWTIRSGRVGPAPAPNCSGCPAPVAARNATRAETAVADVRTNGRPVGDARRRDWQLVPSFAEQ